MKKNAIIALIMCAMSFNACAQWYIFPGNKKASEKTDSVKVQQNQAGVGATEEVQDENTPELEASAISGVYEYQSLETIHAALILPLQADSKPNSNFFELYSGALLAVRDAAGSGPAVSLNVFDSANSQSREYGRILEDNDLVIGPVSVEELYDAALSCPEGKVLVSPLEPKAAGLADSLGVVQAPSTWASQAEELVHWIASDLLPSEKLIVVRDPQGDGEQTEFLLEKIKETGVECTFVEAVTESAFEGLGTKCLIASERDSFLSSSIRSLTALLALGKQGITLYGTSRTRTAAADTKTLHSLNSHLVLGYYTDYNNSKVKDFVLKYRAVFNNEPGSFAFQGYDTMHYFLQMCSRYGKQWYKKLPDFTESGLQAGFRFTSDESRKGFVNSGVRRVVFRTDLSTTLN